MPSSFAIVHFLKTNEIEVVPVSWVKDNGCLWPPLKTSEAQKLVKKLTNPCIDWICHDARVLGSYETFHSARQRLRKAEDLSDLASDADCGRGKRRKFLKSVNNDSSDETSDELTFTERTGIVLPTIDVMSNANEIPESMKEVRVNLENILIPEISEDAHNFEDVPVIDSSVNNSTDNLYKALESLTKEIYTLKENQRIILQNQELIMNKLCETSKVTSRSEFELPFQLPIAKMEELKFVENELKEPAIFEFLIEKLSSCGSLTVDKTVKRIMRKVLKDDVAQNFSWLGAKGKEVFSKLKLSELVFAATRKSSSLAATDEAIEVAIKNWLRNAKARYLSNIKVLETSQSII